jgi:hypothetical protein
MHSVESKLVDTHVAMVGRVERYDATKQVVDVQPMLKRPVQEDTEDADESSGDAERSASEPFPVIPNVPVLFPRAGGFFISFPIQRGDYVQVLFNDWPLDGCLQGDDQGNSFEPQQNHGLNGAVAIAGIYPAAQALSAKDAHADNMVLGKEGGLQIHVTKDHIALGDEHAADSVALADKVKFELQRIVTALNAHTHTSNGIITVPSMANPGSVASTKVKAI